MSASLKFSPPTWLNLDLIYLAREQLSAKGSFLEQGLLLPPVPDNDLRIVLLCVTSPLMTKVKRAAKSWNHLKAECDVLFVNVPTLYKPTKSKQVTGILIISVEIFSFVCLEPFHLNANLKYYLPWSGRICTILLL